MKNKATLSLLLCSLMLYYATPRLILDTSSAQGIFSLAWLLFALLVIGGNVSSFLYAPKRTSQHRKMEKRMVRGRGRQPMKGRG